MLRTRIDYTPSSSRRHHCPCCRPSALSVTTASATRLLVPRAVPVATAPLSADRTAVRLRIGSKGHVSNLTRNRVASYHYPDETKTTADIPHSLVVDGDDHGEATVKLRDACGRRDGCSWKKLVVAQEPQGGTEDKPVVSCLRCFSRCPLRAAVGKNFHEVLPLATSRPDSSAKCQGGN